MTKSVPPAARPEYGILMSSTPDFSNSALLATRLNGVEILVDQVKTMVEGCSRPEGFDARAWVMRWLDGPIPALGALSPLEMLETPEGTALLSRTLAQVQGGSYA